MSDDDEIGDEDWAREGRTEPTPDVREAANGARQMFIALVDEGFSEEQAMRMVITVITGGLRGLDD